MNSIILENHDGVIRSPETLRHIHEVLKCKVGEQLKCTVLNDALFSGEIIYLSQSECRLKLSRKRSVTPPWFDLIVGISRPLTCKKIFEHATTFGVRKIYFYKGELSEKSYFDAKIFQNEEWKKHAIAGLSQSTIYGLLPEVIILPKLELSQFKGNTFVLDPSSNETFNSYKPLIAENTHSLTPLTLALGPERGMANQELEKFHSANFKGIKISASILRVEHAIYASVAQLELLRGVKNIC